MKILDYGCGNGDITMLLARSGSDILAIDKNPPNVAFLKTDCEDTKLENECFDMIHDRGTLTYLNKEKAFREISRILKTKGKVIGIESLGHNPLVNIYRKIRHRTKYGAEEIIKVEDFELAKPYFKEIKLTYWPSFMGKWAYKVIFELTK